MLGALAGYDDIGGITPLGGICIYLGGFTDPPGNHVTGSLPHPLFLLLPVIGYTQFNIED